MPNGDFNHDPHQSLRQEFHCDYGLDLAEFRIYATIARRGECWESVLRIAARCKLGERTVRLALKLLVRAGLIEEESRPGQSTLRRISARDRWAESAKLDEFRAGIKAHWTNRTPASQPTPAPGAALSSGAGDPCPLVQPTPAPGAAKGIPVRKSHEGTPTLRARAQSKFDLAVCERFARTLPRVHTPDAYAKTIFFSGLDDDKIEAWLNVQERSKSAPIPEPMPGTSKPEVLADFLAAAHKRLNPGAYQSWFAPIDRLSVEGDLVRLAVPDPAFREWIDTNYFDVIDEALDEAGLGACRVEWWWAGKLSKMSDGQTFALASQAAISAACGD